MSFDLKQSVIFFHALENYRCGINVRDDIVHILPPEGEEFSLSKKTATLCRKRSFMVVKRVHSYEDCKPLARICGTCLRSARKSVISKNEKTQIPDLSPIDCLPSLFHNPDEANSIAGAVLDACSQSGRDLDSFGYPKPLSDFFTKCKSGS